MKKFTTIICCIAFAIFGIGLAKHGVGPPNNTMSANAAQPVQWQMPNLMPIPVTVPRIPSMGTEEQVNSSELVEPSTSIDSASIQVIDSLKTRIKMLEQKKASSNVETKKVPVPKSIRKKKIKKVFKPDTLPHITKQEDIVDPIKSTIGVEQPTGCVTVYELKAVGEICPEKSNSTKRVNEHDSVQHE